MSEVILFSLGMIIAAVIVVYEYLTWHFNHWKKLGLAGPKPSIIYGNFPNLILEQRNFIYDMDDVYSQYKRNHRAIGVFLSRNPKIMILDPKLARECMSTDFRKYHDNVSSKFITNVSDKFAARNPFFMAGEGWKVNRADALPGLTRNKLNLSYPIWRASAEKMTNYINEQMKNRASTEIEVKDLSYRFTADILGEFLWGIDSGAFTNATKSNSFVEMGNTMLRQVSGAEALYFSLQLAPFMRRFKRCNVYAKESDVFFSNLTKDAIALRLKSPNGLQRADYLNHVLQLQEKKNLSHDDVVGHILTLMLDGFETSAIAVYHTLFYLAKHPEVQDKLRAEIKANLEEEGSLTFDNLNKLPYLDQCVQETLRMVTPVATMYRICTEDTTLEVDLGKNIPVKKGTVIIIPLYSYHHDPEYFPDPYKFYPERFDNGSYSEMTKSGVFMPFSDGPRICPGLRMGMVQVKLALVEIIKQYRLLSTKRTMAEKQPDAVGFIIGLKGEFWLEFQRI